MASAAFGFNNEHYSKLLVQTLPTAIENDLENGRLTAILASLDARFDSLSPEEKRLAGLLTVLIEAYEDKHYSLSGSTPATRLKMLMEEHGLRQRDLVEIFGSRGLTSEVVNGKREISKAAAKKLAAKFHVSAELFL